MIGLLLIISWLVPMIGVLAVIVIPGRRSLSHNRSVSLQRPANQRRPWRFHPEQVMNAWPVAGAMALGISGALLLLLWTRP